ncbi:hypothetical protein POM88_035149 [Heracleum sosnowskyi]|uniref:Uncharacterized protein n=1 Tax=Heracleum sosnowskyi TaxID=360622 RepID=A0AAD8HMT0_9APIA|nr:hypothetical protein POM88_035149 [Heracleum sosnowskyi]
MYNSHLQTLTFRHQKLNHCSIRPIICSVSTKTIVPTNVDSSDFKISFLENKCGLSGKALVNACKYLDFDSSNQRPDSVLQLLQTFGFPPDSITKIIAREPLLLKKYHPQNILKPKLDYLFTVFHPQAEVVAVITRNPGILLRSLTNHLIPSVNLLNSVTGSYTNTLYVLKTNPSILGHNLSKTLLLNTQFLSTLGVSHSQIINILRSYGRFPALAQPHDKFCNFVLKLKDMGYDLETSRFRRAVRISWCLTDSKWESRCVLFRRFGFSDHEIMSMFKKLPEIMVYTDKIINEKLHFFLNKLRWTPSRLSYYVHDLSYSLEKRIIPRCSVLQVLVSKSSMSESYTLSSILKMTEKGFIEVFVTAHKNKVPSVMEAYQGKLRFDLYTYKQKGYKDDIYPAPITLVDQP